MLQQGDIVKKGITYCKKRPVGHK